MASATLDNYQLTSHDGTKRHVNTFYKGEKLNEDTSEAPLNNYGGISPTTMLWFNIVD